MLILNRKIGEDIIINNNIIIKVLDVVEGKVKIGIEAPKEIKILRQEVYEAVKEENLLSMKSSTSADVIDIIKKMQS